MPLAQRRPTLLKLTLPHPPLSCLPASSSNSTANNNNLTTAMTTSPDSNPITPVNRRRDSSNYAHHRTSIDSWCSSVSNESSMGAEYEWTPTQLQTLCKVSATGFFLDLSVVTRAHIALSFSGTSLAVFTR